LKRSQVDADIWTKENVDKRIREGKRRRSRSLLDTMQSGVWASQGTRSNMEDVHRITHISKEDSSTNHDVSFFTVCDGHGGIEAANFVSENLFGHILNRDIFDIDPERALLEGFQSIESEWKTFANSSDIDGTVGTTATTAVVVDNILYVANVGDSEALISTLNEETMLTTAHIPSNPDEKIRIEREGGIILCDKKGNYRLAHPVWNPQYVNLGVTRAIGDLYFKDTSFVKNKISGLIAEPSITKWELTDDDRFLLIASDGFWNSISAQEAVEIVTNSFHLESTEICRNLVELSESRSNNFADNATVILIKFVPPITSKL